jgi:hypothetical protein
MELFVNGQKLDIQLENEKTVGDVLKSFQEECEKTQAATVTVCVNGKNISAEEFDETCKEDLTDSTKIELGVVSKTAIDDAFKAQKEEALKLAEELKEISVKFQTGKDKEANTLITRLADLIDSVCHTAGLSALFPESFGKISIDGKNFMEFFEDFSPVLKDFEQSIASKDTVMTGDLAEYEISPRLESLSKALEI